MTSKNAPERIAIYARISRDESGYAVGVADQSVRCREMAARQWPGAQIAAPGCTCGDCERYQVPADVYCDNDITASGKKDRPHYRRLLADIAAGKVDLVVSSHNDRLHRSPVELEEYINVCQPREVPTHYVKAGTYDLTTASGRMVARMLGAMARAEWERMVERQQAAKRRNRDAGIRQAGGRPFGYRLDERDARGYQIPGVSKGLVVVESEAEAVRAAYADVLAGVSLQAIARRWNKAGLRTARTGGEWTSVQVRRVLCNPAYAGLIEYQGSSVRARWDPIIGEDVYKAVRALITSPERRISPGPKPKWLLTGVLICGVCGSRYFSVRVGGSSAGHGRAYACASVAKNPGGPKAGWHLTRNVALLDEYVEWVVLELLSKPEVVAALNTGPEVDMAALEARRSALNTELDEIAAERGLTPRQKAKASEGPIAELDEIDKQIAEALHRDRLPEFTGNDPAKVWAELKAAGNIERMRAVVRMLVRVRVNPTTRRGPGFDYSAVDILDLDGNVIGGD